MLTAGWRWKRHRALLKASVLPTAATGNGEGFGVEVDRRGLSLWAEEAGTLLGGLRGRRHHPHGSVPFVCPLPVGFCPFFLLCH